MNLLLNRETFTDKSTIGSLLIDGHFFCYTLEDVVRGGNKIPGKTAIPYGTYKIIINMSNRFKQLMPQLLDVPKFEGIRIHSGNTAEDTEGCILVGFKKGIDIVTESRLAFKCLFASFQSAINHGERITIDIKKTVDGAETAASILATGQRS